MALPDKAAIHAALLRALEAAVASMSAVASDTRAAATHEENRPENIKDMRATEQSYIARGQAMRAEALAEELGRLRTIPLPRLLPGDPIVPGATVRLEIEDDLRVVFLAPHAGGTVVEVDRTRVTVVTLTSPLGAALLGKHTGDDFDLVIQGKRREHHIVEID